MVDFRTFPPMNLDKRKEAVEHGITRCLNGSQFKFVAWGASNFIRGQYKDYAGEWVLHIWDKNGKVLDREFAEFDLDWGSAR